MFIPRPVPPAEHCARIIDLDQIPEAEAVNRTDWGVQ